LREVHLAGVVVGNVAAILSDAPMLTRDVDIFVGDKPRVRKKMDALAKALAGAAPQPILRDTLAVKKKLELVQRNGKKG
jgi:hypothetical protein